MKKLKSYWNQKSKIEKQTFLLGSSIIIVMAVSIGVLLYRTDPTNPYNVAFSIAIVLGYSKLVYNEFKMK